jgi:hypothetical protein
MSIPELADITTCVHCGQKFTHPRITIIGAPKARLDNYMAGLAKHLVEKHPEIGEQMVPLGSTFMELLFLRNFKTTDPELNEQQDRVRWQIHQQTLKARYPDENLIAQCRYLSQRLVDTMAELDNEAPGMVAHGDLVRSAYECILIEVVTAIRDALEEPGKYGTAAAAASKVLV